MGRRYRDGPMSVDEPGAGTGTAGMATCFSHPDRPTGRRCTRCGRPACATCLRQAAVGSHCFECARAATPPRSEVRRFQRVLGGHPLTATKAIIAVNAAVFVIGVVVDGGLVATGELQRDYGIYGPAIDQTGQWWRIVSGGFLHAGLLHLGMNMLFLWILGRQLEPALGSARFVIVYAAGLLGGSAGALLLDPLALTVGASGAIYGLLGAAFLGTRTQSVETSDSGLGGLLVVNLLLTFVIPGISIGGHLGGLAVGGLAGWLLWRPDRGRRAVAAVIASLAVVLATWFAAVEAASRWMAHL